MGVLVGALFSMKVGKELVEDPEYQKRPKEVSSIARRWRFKT